MMELCGGAMGGHIPYHSPAPLPLGLLYHYLSSQLYSVIVFLCLFFYNFLLVSASVCTHGERGERGRE